MRRQNPNSYALQLLAVSSETAARGYIEKHDLRDRAAYFRIERGGRTLYPILYGVYADREAALAARARLPAALDRQGVWARSFASVQALFD